MLDDVTKKRINTLRQILVGKLPDPKAQVEQITNGLIYKFMNDMDQQSVSMGGKSTYFSGKFQKYSWKNLMDTKTSGVEKIKLYSEAIEQMYTNENLPELFREIFKNSFLPFKDPSTLNMFMKEINEFHYSNSEKLGDAFEYLLSFMGSQGDAGQFRTPRHIIDFITEIVNPQKNETVLDPACGTAGFLISTYKHILKQNTKKNTGDGLNASDRKRIGENLNGYDISPDMVKMSLVNMYLHKFTNPKINEYDTLSSEDRWNEYYDVILANPPFFSPRGGITPHNRFGVNSSKAEVLFIDYINEHLKPKGRAGIIVPEGVIFQTGTAYKQLRKKLIETSLVGVISLPAGVFQPYSGVKTSILFLDKENNKKNKDIFFGIVKHDGFSLNVQRTPIRENDLIDLKNNIKHNTENNKFFILDKNKLLSRNDFSFSLSVYEEQKISSNYENLKLGEVAEFINGAAFKPSDWGDEGTPIIRIQNLTKTNSKFNKTTRVVDEKYIVKNGDLLISWSATIGVYIWNGPDAYLNQHIFLVKNNNKILKKYLYFLKDQIINQIKSKVHGNTMTHITKGEFLDIKISVPPIEIQNQIVEELDGYQKIIDGCRQVIENYKPSIDIDPSWKMVEIGQLCLLMTGGTPKTDNKEFYENGDVPWLVSGDIHKVEIHNSNKFITKKGVENSSTKFLPVNSVLIALNGQGKTRGTVAILRMKATCNQSIVSIKPNDEGTLKTEFLYLYLNSIYKNIRNLTGDNQRSGLNMPIIRKIKIPLAPIEEQIKFINMWNSEKNMININSKTIDDFQKKIQSRIEKIWSN